MSELREQIAVVTGAASGIGEAIAKKLSRQGAKVLLVDCDERNVTRVEREIINEGFKGCAHILDVTDAKAVSSFFNSMEETYGKLDILVNNAGIAGQPVRISEMPENSWSQMLDIHVNGTFYFLKNASQLMKKNRYGRIVNMSSLAAERGLAGHAHYSAAKYAIVGLTEVAAKELGPYNITVNSIKPGLIRTPLSSEGLLSRLEGRLKEATPVKEIGEPEDVARAVYFLVHPDSAFLTGISITVDGGMNIIDEQDKVALEAFKLTAEMNNN